MRKHLFIFLSLFLFALMAEAAPVSKSAATAIARDFLSARGIKMKQPRFVLSAPTPHQPSSPAAYYVFNAGNQKGFVIVSGDDRTEQILGYSDSGSFPSQEIPDNMRSFLQSYADQIGQLDQMNEEMTGGQYEGTPVRNAISPLISSTWGQDYPYNSHCPVYRGQKTVTGCVATAVAQVMAYHQYPKATTATIPAYTTDALKLKCGQINSNSTIDWENILPRYSGTESTEQKEAVANLMAYVGRSIYMDYDIGQNGGSGASDYAVAPALSKYFDYSARLINRRNYSKSAFDEAIYNELLSRRPVVFCGASTGGGHSFVLDGYDGKGMFHVNWGWNGMSDGYFLISILNPNNTTGTGASSSSDGYSMQQTAIIDIHPHGKPVAPGLTMNLKRISGHEAVLQVYNLSGTDNTFEYGIGFIDDHGTITMTSTIASVSLRSFYGMERHVILKLPKELGSYRVMPISRIAGTQEWSYDIDCYAMVTVTEQGATASFIDYSDPSHLTTDHIMAGGFKQQGIEQPISFELINSGKEDFYGNIYLFASTTQTKGRPAASTSPSVSAGSKEEIDMSFTPNLKGKYNIWIATDTQGKNVIGQAQVDIQPRQASGKLDVTFSYDGMTNGTLFGKMIKGKAHVVAKSGNSQGTISIYCTDSKGNFIGTASQEIDLQQGNSIDIPFEFHTISTGTHSLIVYNGQDFITQAKRFLYSGAILYKADGTENGVKINDGLKIPDDVVAVDLTGVQPKPIEPNNNPNTLYYVKVSDASKFGLEGKNVIVNGIAENIKLEDGHDFYCPLSFRANHISYTRTAKRQLDKAGGWETIALPFDATDATIDGTTAQWYTSTSDKGKQFWVMNLSASQGDNLIFSHAESTLRACVPYLLGIPDAGTDGRTVSFSATDIVVNSSPLCLTASTDYSFCGGLSTKQVSAYLLNEEGTKFCKTTGTVAPFRAYIEPTQADNQVQQLNILLTGRSVLSGISSISETDTLSTAPVFDCQGRKVAGSFSELKQRTMPKGVYIVGGKKVVLR
ncbi:C10 family peptidase [Prevotella dentasini]|uniref:C10 family peptidase n=1 Tax=Prevotella dentasini TaxID=589537 RepID=UPI000AA2AF4D|nr:C10 family peptidase [Prevotella dentasini]